MMMGILMDKCVNCFFTTQIYPTELNSLNHNQQLANPNTRTMLGLLRNSPYKQIWFGKLENYKKYHPQRGDGWARISPAK
jgi:hypothetical protein